MFLAAKTLVLFLGVLAAPFSFGQAKNQNVPGIGPAGSPPDCLTKAREAASTRVEDLKSKEFNPEFESNKKILGKMVASFPKDFKDRVEWCQKNYEQCKAINSNSRQKVVDQLLSDLDAFMASDSHFEPRMAECPPGYLPFRIDENSCGKQVSVKTSGNKKFQILMDCKRFSKFATDAWVCTDMQDIGEKFARPEYTEKHFAEIIDWQNAEPRWEFLLTYCGYTTGVRRFKSLGVSGRSSIKVCSSLSLRTGKIEGNFVDEWGSDHFFQDTQELYFAQYLAAYCPLGTAIPSNYAYDSDIRLLKGEIRVRWNPGKKSSAVVPAVK